MKKKGEKKSFFGKKKGSGVMSVKGGKKKKGRGGRSVLFFRSGL